MNDESGGLHFAGNSSTGKSTALDAGASVWGCPVHSWRTTDNAAEALARSASDALLCMDELSQADGKAADALTYMIGNGAGKSRMRRDATARPTIRWRVLFLSSGEIGLASKLEEAGRSARAGQSVRMIEIPADAGKKLGMFENLHGSPSGEAFSDRIKLATKAHSGHAARVFLENITSRFDGLADAVRAGKRRWTDENLPTGADGQVARVAGRFALIAAAGELATAMSILPWPNGEATKAAATCFNAWLDARGGKGSAEMSAGITQVRKFLVLHGSSRFEPAWERDNNGNPLDFKATNRIGFRRKDDEGNWEYIATAEGFKEMVKGFDAKALTSELVKAGMLQTDGEGKASVHVRVPGQAKGRYYVFPASALMNGGDHA